MLRFSSGLHNPFHGETQRQQPSNSSQQDDVQTERNTQGTDMTADQTLNEIRDANLSYLMLAQNLIRGDRESALFRLGISEETASMISLMSSAQMMKIASGNTLLCRFRMDDDMVWGLLTNHGKSAANDTTSRLHASILMAGRYTEAA
jgi:flagellar transcriptional activator FlhD